AILVLKLGTPVLDWHAHAQDGHTRAYDEPACERLVLIMDDHVNSSGRTPVLAWRLREDQSPRRSIS
ncbi:hypothetical protein CR513_39742, partial [Mucuna pruriens]